MKVYVHPPGESWICDRMVEEWREHNQDISILDPKEADIIWLMADWTYNHFPLEFLKSKKVLTTCFHVIPEQSGDDFKIRDSITDLYHASCIKTKNALQDLGATKPIKERMLWYNDNVWKPEYDLLNQGLCRYGYKELYGFDGNEFIIGSFQRDTEGSDLVSPKMVKGPDIFCDFVEEFASRNPDKKVSVLLGAWRRQYVMNRLDKAKIKYIYKELPDLITLRKMYSILDLYVVGSRLEGGPQSIYECAALNVPIISTDVGIAEEILNPKSISKYMSADSLTRCEPDVLTASIQVSKYTIENTMPIYRKMLEELNEQ